MPGRARRDPRTAGPDPRLDARGVAIATAFGALALSMPAILNGAPFLYFDSEAYIRRAGTALAAVWPGAGPPAPSGAAGLPEGAERVVIAGRSVYYGLFAYGALRLTAAWGLVAAQGAALAFTVALALRHVAPGAGLGAALATLAALALLTPAGLFAGLVMPDLWAGILVLAAALLVTARARLSAPARGALMLLATFAVLSHTSHALLLAGGLGALGLAWAVAPRARRHLSMPAISALAGCLLIGALGLQAFAALTERVTGAPPVARPHLTARLIDAGPGTAHARAACPEAGYALCAHVAELPQDWIAFLFAQRRDAGPAGGIFATASPALKRALAAEERRFALGTLAHDPAGALGALAWGGLSQLWTLSVGDLVIGPRTSAARLDAVPEPLLAMTRASHLWRHPDALARLTPAIHASAAVSAALLAAALAARRAPRAGGGLPPRLLAFIVICLGGLVLNAVICGALASPYGRFQARVVWIVTLLAAMALAARPQEARA